MTSKKVAVNVAEVTKKTNALFDAYRMMFDSLFERGLGIVGDDRLARADLNQVMDEKYQAIYHRRPLSSEQREALNDRQRHAQHDIEAAKARMSEVGGDVADLCVIVDENTTPAERIKHFDMKPGTFDHSVATMGHLIFAGALKSDYSKTDVLKRALSIACVEYLDQMYDGPIGRGLEHVVSQDVHAWMFYGKDFVDDTDCDDADIASPAAEDVFEFSPFGRREFLPPLVDGEDDDVSYEPGACANPIL